MLMKLEGEIDLTDGGGGGCGVGDRGGGGGGCAKKMLGHGSCGCKFGCWNGRLLLLVPA